MMSAKKMVETYVSYECSNETWKMFYLMRCHNLISEDNWDKFTRKCKGWYVDEDGIRDMDDDDKLVYDRDADGFLNLIKK